MSITDLWRESAQFAAAASVAWSYWVLAALGRALQAIERVSKAVTDIQQSVFYRGDMPQLLADLGLSDLGRSDQHRVGLAVARRWADSSTFLASEDVIQPLAAGSATYPPAFNRGILEGLLLTAFGTLRMTPSTVQDAALVADRLDQQTAAELSQLVDVVGAATPSYSLIEPNEEVLTQLEKAARTAKHAEAREIFDAVRQRLEHYWNPR